ncbi:hypothetical protein [Sphingomonas sp.]|uniref:hypothetical protein n=1 Tax=Sphingomonas sp. TaxID=28214 RepID=UPI00286C2B85|nr:hypothetical protein [Sphingomonas sp.]
MATIAKGFTGTESRIDVLSGTPRAHVIDRWIFVFMAAWFIAIVLTGFIPDSIMKIGMVRAGARPPFPPVLHMHAVLMGSFLLLLLTQTTLMATGRRALHMKLGIAGVVLAVALVTVGFVLAPTMYHETWNALQSAPPNARAKLQEVVTIKENILLLQLRIGILFPLFLAIGIRARSGNAGLHKRMMILATVMALPAGIDRIAWLPTTIPASPLSVDLYTILAISPMLVWDVVRNHSVHRAYWIWFAVTLPVAVVVNLLWDTPAWHATARQIMGVG